MAEAQFMPAQAPGTAVQDFIKGDEAGQSLMIRAQQAQQEQQLRQQEIAKNQMLLPVAQAKAQADIVSAHSAVSAATRMQQFRTQAAAVAPQANNEFLDATSLADWDAQSNALGQLQAKYSWMSQLPEYKGFLDAIDNARANAVKRSITDQQLDAAQDRLQIQQDMLNQRTGMVVGGREDVAQTNAAARTGAAQITGDSRVQAAGVRANKNYELERSIQLMNDARDRGDNEEAQFYANRIQKLNQISGTTPNSPAVVPAKPVGSAPAQSQPPAPLTFDSSERDAGDQPATSETPSDAGSAVSEQPEPTQATAPSAPAAAPASAKLYVAPAKAGDPIQFAPNVKTPKDILAAVQQMLADRVISEEQARKYLLSLGFKPKQ